MSDLDPPDPPDPPDADAAMGASTHLRRRRATGRRAAAGVGAAVLVLVGALAVSSAVGGDDRGDPTLVAGPDQEAAWPESASKAQNALRLDLDAPTSGKLGTRVRFTVRLTNVSDDPIPVNAGGACEDLIGVELVPVGNEGHEGTRSTAGQPGPWDGELSTLPAVLAEPRRDPPAVASSVADDDGGWSCAALGHPPRVLAPGEVEVQDMILDLRWGTGDVGPPRELLVRSGPTGMDRDPAVELRAPFALEDDPDRLATLDAARAAGGVASAPTLAEWVALLTKVFPGGLGPGAVQSYRPELTWWQGYWELWINPQLVDGNVFGALRIRWEAAQSRVTEVRMVPSFLAPDDDPDARARGRGISDEIRYHLD